MVSERLSVYLHNSLAGYLWLSDTNRYSFQYDPGYLEDLEAIPLSLSLPMREAPYTNQLNLKFSYLKRLFKEMAEKLEKDTLEMADSIILEFNGEKTIQKICGIIKTHILHVKTYL